ncbi:MAG: hypothetical protein JNJ99_13635, partial [Crocinitomicaceae bacterium]|nr:hypothetical protein [Crocinitomicaceae bacterium]
EALITYHPEYEYLVPFDELCQFTGTTLPISSEKYDAELMEIQTYAEATNPTNSFGVNLLANIDNIMLYDPYFEAPYTYTENVLAGGNTFKEILMTEILHNYKQDFPADGAHLWETAVNAAVCSPDYAGTCAITTAMANGDLTGLSVAEQDQAWSNFRALYISEKKKINQVFIDSYAISNGFYNGYIGESAPSYPAITGFLYYTDHVLPGLSIAFPPPTFYGGSVHLLSFYATALVNSGAGLTWMSAPFTPLYQDKIRRFIPIDNLYDSSMPETIIISSTEEVVDAEIYNQTGKCDLAIDVEYFLNGMATASLFDEALSTGVPSYQIPELSPDLYTAMGGVIMSPGVTGTTVNVTATQTSNSITITANSADGIAAMQSITLNKPIGATWNWTDVVGFSTIWYQFGTNYNFEILATVMISGSPVEVVLTGSTGIQIGNCVYQQPCERDETFGHEVFFIFNNLFNQSLLNTSVSSNVTATTVTQGWYESSEMQTQLVDFASTATFTNNPAGYFSIATSSHELKVNFGSYPSNILVVNSAAYNPTSQQITLYYVNTSGVEMTATATVTYTINNVPANMDLNCDGCQLETDIETAFENLLNYIIQQDLAGTLTGSSMPNFSQLNALAPYLTVSSPEIHFMFGAGTISDDNEFRFRFSKTECPITFQQISTSEDLTNLVGIYNLQIT